MNVIHYNLTHTASGPQAEKRLPNSSLDIVFSKSVNPVASMFWVLILFFHFTQLKQRKMIGGVGTVRRITKSGHRRLQFPHACR